MRICLVRLPSPYLINEKAFPPLGLLTIATVLKKDNRNDVIVYDDDIRYLPSGFDAYAMGPSVTEYGSALMLKDIIRQETPGARIVLGGPHPTLNSNRCINDGFDCVVTGDGEPVAMDAFTGNRKGIFNGGEEGDLNTYPIADRSFINQNEYQYHLNDRLTAPIVSSRGCPFRCAFCSRMYSKVRMRSADHVISEIDYLRTSLSYRSVMFFDDTFIVDRERTTQIATYLSKVGMIWRCLVRGDIIVQYGEDFTKMMHDNGCVEVGMGIESGSDRILKNINKRESISTIKSAIKLLKSSGIRVKGFFIIGLPGEDKDSLKETDDFVKETELDDMDFSIFKPYAGSTIYEHPERFDIAWDDMDYALTFYKGNGRHKGGNIRTSHLTSDQISEAMYDLERKYKHWISA